MEELSKEVMMDVEGGMGWWGWAGTVAGVVGLGLTIAATAGFAAPAAVAIGVGVFGMEARVMSHLVD